MKRVFKTRTFSRSMKKTALTDAMLCVAIEEMDQGLVDASLGGNIVKKRVSLIGVGKRSGVRTIVATKMATRWFFLYGFRKNERTSISQRELKVLQHLAHDLLGYDDRQLRVALDTGEIEEICHDKP